MVQQRPVFAHARNSFLAVFEMDLDAYSLDDIEAAEESWGRGSLARVTGFP